MKNSTNQNQRSYTDLVSTDATKSRRLSLLWLMLFTLLLMPARMGGRIQHQTPAVLCSLNWMVYPMLPLLTIPVILGSC